MPPRKLTRSTVANVLQAKETGGASETDRMFGLSGVLPRLVEVDLDAIAVNPDQPRTVFDEESLRSLAASIETHGLQQPILVQSTEEKGRYRLVAGERRLRAHQMLGRRTIAAIITKGRADEIALIENVQRVDLDAVDLARGLERLIQAHGYTQAEAGAVVGLSDTDTSRRLSVLSLPADVIEQYQREPGAVSKSVLYEIASVEGQAEQRTLWAKARQGMTVKEVRASKPRLRPTVEPMRLLGISLARIGKDVAAMRQLKDNMAEEHRERLRALRREIDELLG
ncbi:ParB/RepB/Spo0J family partition protein [Azospirillum sp. RWY-5-1]|uniref:ParB/RepB/Spo0J family partition protein n=1 Tax=Azospirillum oleiclasticum TaxID=2735135 RepID=A0ABX2TKV1_9PROT|nr:ParB/RepB/Spo0J family partition protein [Azospirillum oleiclasticum]NYZ16338.1 ParB/RepB/Spo0J family partition protein [Azospirillum oleiclasticum]NYZ23946.1 ParB/RepB/Spo0J family partition protein [Azospirillum oleiclasticum]